MASSLALKPGRGWPAIVEYKTRKGCREFEIVGCTQRIMQLPKRWGCLGAGGLSMSGRRSKKSDYDEQISHLESAPDSSRNLEIRLTEMGGKLIR
jgi:hypothetical protein